jgi:hypothetical protein
LKKQESATAKDISREEAAMSNGEALALIEFLWKKNGDSHGRVSQDL